MPDVPNLMVVESPNKAKTIQKYVGSQIKVMASYGHFRDLPPSAMGVDYGTWKPTYEVPKDKVKTVKALIAEAKRVQSSGGKIYIAADPDREGEAIAYHLAVIFRIRPEDVLRVTYGDVSKESILAAIKNPSSLDMYLVKAQESRRVVDRLIGYIVSPLLKKATGLKGIKAGRVQTVAVRLIVERFHAHNGHSKTHHFGAELELEDCEATWNTKPVLEQLGTEYILERQLAEIAANETSLIVTSIETKKTSSKPSAPFKTTTMTKVASQKLGFKTKQTMKAAQVLFEQGLITYMRTDSIEMLESDIDKVRDWACQQGYPVPDKPNVYKNNSKNAQEAHVAIHPTNLAQESVSTGDADADALYELIFQRTLVSQLAPAKYLKTIVTFRGQSSGYEFVAKGSKTLVAGFTQLTKDSDEDTLLPSFNDGDVIDVLNGSVIEKQTKPPALFNETSLIDALEKRGIGRPSTYASIISAIQVFIVEEKGKFKPNELGEQVYQNTLNMGFVDYDFTADIENKLDLIVEGKSSFKEVVTDVFDRVMVDMRTKLNYQGSDEDLFVIYDDQAPSEPKLNYARRIAESPNAAELTEADMATNAAIQRWIDENISKQAPTPKTLEWAESIAQELGISLPDETRNSGELCSKFIDQYKGQLPPRPNSIKLAEKIAREKEIDLPEDARKTSKACQAFIDEHGDKSKSKRRAKKRGAR